MSPKLIEALREFAEKSPMKCVVVSSQAEFDAAVEDHAKDGRRLAAVSNAGLAPPFKRLTFLPNSAFSSDQQQESRSMSGKNTP